LPASAPLHPGLALTKAIAATKLSRAHAAAFLGISRKHLYDIMDGRKGISARVALRLGKFFDSDPMDWLHLQDEYELWQARDAVDLSAIPTFKVANVP
jgi:addiction module HigA family antidote